MKVLTRDQILSFTPKVKDVPVEPLGGSVGLRVMSGADREAFLLLCDDPANKKRNVEVHLLTFCLCDDRGTRLFQVEDAPTLHQILSHDIISKLAGEAMEINGLAYKAVQELGKDSGASQNG